MKLRGATLIEMMVVVAILAVMAAVAAPQLLPTIKRARLAGEAEALAGFLNAVRERAIADGRCYRVLVTATQLTAERRTTGDCATPGAVIGNGEWQAKTTLKAEPGTSYRYDTAQDLRQPGPAPLNTGTQNIIFRPSGRLRGSNDVAVGNDRARIVVSQASLTQTKSVVVMETGRVCVISHAAAAPGAFSGVDNATNSCTQAVQ